MGRRTRLDPPVLAPKLPGELHPELAIQTTISDVLNHVPHGHGEIMLFHFKHHKLFQGLQLRQSVYHLNIFEPHTHRLIQVSMTRWSSDISRPGDFLAKRTNCQVVGPFFHVFFFFFFGC